MIWGYPYFWKHPSSFKIFFPSGHPDKQGSSASCRSPCQCVRNKASQVMFFFVIWVPFNLSVTGREPLPQRMVSIHSFTSSPNEWFGDFGQFFQLGTIEKKVFAAFSRLFHNQLIKASWSNIHSRRFPSRNWGATNTRRLLGWGKMGGALMSRANPKIYPSLPVSLISLRHDHILVILVPKRNSFVPVDMFQHLPLAKPQRTYCCSVQDIMLIW